MPDHTASVPGDILRFQPDTTNADYAVLVEPPVAAKAVVITADGAAAKVASSATAGSTMGANHVAIASAGSYTLTLVEHSEQVGQARDFYVSSATTSGYVALQYVGW